MAKNKMTDIPPSPTSANDKVQPEDMAKTSQSLRGADISHRVEDGCHPHGWQGPGRMPFSPKED